MDPGIPAHVVITYRILPAFLQPQEDLREEKLRNKSGVLALIFQKHYEALFLSVICVPAVFSEVMLVEKLALNICVLSVQHLCVEIHLAHCLQDD